MYKNINIFIVQIFLYSGMFLMLINNVLFSHLVRFSELFEFYVLTFSKLSQLNWPKTVHST